MHKHNLTETQFNSNNLKNTTTNINNNAVINHHDVTNLGVTIKILYL